MRGREGSERGEREREESLREGEREEVSSRQRASGFLRPAEFLVCVMGSTEKD